MDRRKEELLSNPLPEVRSIWRGKISLPSLLVYHASFSFLMRCSEMWIDSPPPTSRVESGFLNPRQLFSTLYLSFCYQKSPLPRKSTLTAWASIKIYQGPENFKVRRNFSGNLCLLPLFCPTFQSRYQVLNTFSLFTTSIFSPSPFSPFLSSHPSFYNNLLIVHKPVQLQSIFHISGEQIWQKQSPDENPLWLNIFRIKFKLAVLLHKILPDLIPAFSRPTSIMCSFTQYIFIYGGCNACQAMI